MQVGSPGDKPDRCRTRQSSTIARSSFALMEMMNTTHIQFGKQFLHFFQCFNTKDGRFRYSLDSGSDSSKTFDSDPDSDSSLVKRLGSDSDSTYQWFRFQFWSSKSYNYYKLEHDELRNMPYQQSWQISSRIFVCFKRESPPPLYSSHIQLISKPNP